MRKIHQDSYSSNLSIITINRNNAAGLEKTLASVACQTSRDFEHIVIDGASTDGSMAVIEQYAAHSNGIPVHWISEPDTGIYNAMNKGIGMAKGDYCQFLNSGDLLAAPDVTAKMLTGMPDTAILIGNMIKVMPGGKLYRDKGKAIEKLTFLTFYGGTLNHSPAYIKRSLFNQYGLYDETLKIVSDWKWYLQVVGLHNETVVYRDVDVTVFDMEGISNSNQPLERIERRKVLEELVPVNVLSDYDVHFRNIDQANRINHYFLSRKLFWFFDRMLFQIEKHLNLKKEYR